MGKHIKHATLHYILVYNDHAKVSEMFGGLHILSEMIITYQMRVKVLFSSHNSLLSQK